MRVLYVHPGLGPPPKDAHLDQMYYVPDEVCGDVLFPTWCRSQEQLELALGEDAFPARKVGEFTYHFFLAGKLPFLGTKFPHGHPFQKLCIFWFFLSRGYQLFRKQKYDCIVTYGWTLTGFSAYVLRWMSGGAKLVVELGHAPHQYNQFGRFNSRQVTWGMKVAKRASDWMLNLIAGGADRLILRYPTQVDSYPKVRKVPFSIIHGFRPVSHIALSEKSENYILLVGAPWFLKGVDLLVLAFHKIKHEFPDVMLRALGHYPDDSHLQALIAGEPRIEIMKARKNAEALEIIRNCLVFALASRTETQGRVLLEAMAAGKPIVASNTDGIPHYINHGVNGLLFQSEDPDDLAEKLRMLLRSPELRMKLGHKGYEFAHNKYSEAEFGAAFAAMVKLTVNGSDGPITGTQSHTNTEQSVLRASESR